MIAGAASAAIEIATIKRQKFAKGGEVKGALHSSGGVPIEAEGGEYVVNRNSTSKHKLLLEAINEDDQVKLMIAMNRDKAVKKHVSDPMLTKIYEQLKKQPVYGETPEYYLIHQGNKTIKLRKHE